MPTEKESTFFTHGSKASGAPRISFSCGKEPALRKTKELITVIKKVERKTRPFMLPITTKVGKTHSAFKVLISTVLSPQTKDTTTGPAFARLMKLASSPRKILKLSNKQIERAIYPVSFYRTKAKNVKKICKILLEKYDGKVPASMQALLELPGVGRKVAGLVMIYGFGKTESIPVDTHCHRIPQRLGWFSSRTPEETEKKLMELVPRRYWKGFNNTFVKFGQNICLPVKPKCWECPVNKHCKYYKNVYLRNINKKKTHEQGSARWNKALGNQRFPASRSKASRIPSE